MRARAGWVLWLACGLGLLPGCGPDGGGYVASCAPVDLSCQPAYEPSFDRVFAQTLRPRCALPGDGCHSAQGAQDGLILEEEQESYELLLGIRGGRARVIPGDPSCSILTLRLVSPAPSLRMPPGDALAEDEICAINLWIYKGASQAPTRPASPGGLPRRRGR